MVRLFESHRQPLATPAVFYRRLTWFFAATAAVVALTLGIGMAGYHHFIGLPWVDSFLEAAMILGGMGPVSRMPTPAGKIFAGTYALFCAFLLIVVSGLMLAPFFHRLLHRFHIDEDS
jgi:hypothetical protein